MVWGGIIQCRTVTVLQLVGWSIPIGIGNGSFLTSRLGLIHRLGVYCFEISKLVLQLVGWSLVDGFTAHVVDYGVGAVH